MESKKIWIVIVILLLAMSKSQAAKKEFCKVILGDSMDTCESNNNDTLCSNDTFCKKTIQISELDLSPFTDIIQKILGLVLSKCCGSCVRSNTNRTYSDLSSFLKNVYDNDTSDFIYPFLAEKSKTKKFGFDFIEFIEVPTLIYITKSERKKTLYKLLTACWALWPLLLTCVTFAFIAGIVVWALDTWYNEEEFPRTFYKGVFEGFWWSFISMTTVGYGDKSPRCICARLWAVVWILVGITICSMFTASLTTAITEATNHYHAMHGSKVASLPNRLYELSYIVKHGGQPYISDNKTLADLVEMLKAGDSIEGILVDEISANSNPDMMDDETLTRTKRWFEKNSYVYGMIMRHKEDYEYIEYFAKENKMTMESCMINKLSKALKPVTESGTQSVFDVKTGLFEPIFYSSLGIIALMCIFGMIYEFYRRSQLKNNKIIIANPNVEEDKNEVVEVKEEMKLSSF